MDLDNENIPDGTADDDAVLAGIFADAEITSDEPDPVSAPEAKDTQSEEVALSDDAQDDAGDPADEAELVRAREFIKREKLIPQDVMEVMTPEQVLAAGEAARERIAEKTRQWQRLQELESQEAPTSTEEPSTTATPAVDDDWAQPFVDELGEDLAGRLVEKLNGYEKRENELREQVATLHQARMEAIETDARQRVGERFPAVMDDAIYTAMASRMESLAKTGGYTADADGALRLIEDCAKLEGLEESTVTAPPSNSKRKFRRNGLPSHNGKGPTQTLSPKDLDDQIALASAVGDYERVADLRAQAERL